MGIAELLEDIEDNEEVLAQQLPTQKEYNEMVERKAQMQNQTHADKCGSCIKAANLTGNPAANLLYCKYNGVMVNKFQACCGEYKCRK